MLGQNNRRKKASFDEDLLDRTLIDSVILENNEQYRDLMKLCQMEGQKWRLLYRATRDGFRAADFHQKCDDKPNTLTIVKATTSAVFGGFTQEPWSSDDEYRPGSVSLLFSLVNEQNSPITLNCTHLNNGIYCNKDLGPCFGEGDLKIANSSNKNKKSRCCTGHTYQAKKADGTLDHKELFLAGSEYFQSEEIEVFIKNYKPLNDVIFLL